MFSKSPSVSSVDSGLDRATKKKSKIESNMPINYEEHIYQENNSVISSDEDIKELVSKISPINKKKDHIAPKVTSPVKSNSSLNNQKVKIIGNLLIKSVDNPSKPDENETKLQKMKKKELLELDETHQKTSPRKNFLNFTTKQEFNKNKMLDKFLQDHTDLNQVEIDERADFNKLDSDDEVYILQMPKTIDPKIMEGATFPLNKKSKIRTELGKYKIIPQTLETSSSSYSIYSNTLKQINPVQILKMEKYFKIKKQEEIIVEKRKPQPLPKNIKLRHPLFGSEYNAEIQLQQQIREKLEQALQRFNEKPKKSKSKKTKNVVEEEDKSSLIAKILEDRFDKVNKSKLVNENVNNIVVKSEILDEKDLSKKKSKKRKHLENKHDQLELSVKQEVRTEDELCETDSPKKKKKKKKHIENKSIDDAEENINFELGCVKKEVKLENDNSIINEENQFQEKKKKHKKDKKQIPDVELEQEEQNNDEIHIKKKKKKKKSTEDDDCSVLTTNLPEDLNKISKKRRKSMLNSTQIIDTLNKSTLKIDVSKIEMMTPIKKKNKDPNNDLITNLLSKSNIVDICNSEQKIKNKKKKS